MFIYDDIEVTLPRADALGGDIALADMIEAVGTYSVKVRAEKFAYEPSAYSTGAAFMVNSLESPFPVVPADKWSVYNSGRDPFVTVTVV